MFSNIILQCIISNRGTKRPFKSCDHACMYAGQKTCSALKSVILGIISWRVNWRFCLVASQEKKNKSALLCRSKNLMLSLNCISSESLVEKTEVKQGKVSFVDGKSLMTHHQKNKTVHYWKKFLQEVIYFLLLLRSNICNVSLTFFRKLKVQV